MVLNFRNLRFSALGLFLFLIGHLLRPVAMDPDVHFSGVHLLGSFFIFGSWAIALLSIGFSMTHLLPIREKSVALWFALGTLAFITYITLAGSLGILHYRQEWILLILMLGGWLAPAFISPGEAPEVSPRCFDPKDKLEVFATLLALGFLVAQVVWVVLEGSLPSGYSDPLFYHLVGPRAWVDHGSIYFSDRWPYGYEAVYWEYLYACGNLLLGEPNGKGLIECQLFAQWTHGLIGYGGALFGLFALFKPVCRQNLWLLALVFTAICNHTLSPIASLAKNDWGIILWILSGSLLLVSDSKKRWVADAFAGIFFGFAMIEKPTAMFPIAGATLIAFLVFERKLSPRDLIARAALVAFFTGLAALPVLVRNQIALGNPFYPYMATRFGHAHLSDDVRILMRKAEPGRVPNLSIFLKTAWDLLKGSFNWPSFQWPYLGLLILLGAALGRGTERKKLALMTVVSSISVVWFPLLEFKADYFVRWVGLGLLFFPILMVLSLHSLYFRCEKALPHFVGISIPLILILTGFPYPWFVRAANAVITIAPNEVIRSNIHIGGAAKAWLRLNLRSGETAVSTGDGQIYYVSHLGVSSVLEDDHYNREIRALKTQRDLVQYLRRSGIKYLLDSGHWNNPFWGWFAAAIHNLLKGNEKAICFESPNSIVIDVPRLVELAGTGSESEHIYVDPG